MIPKGARLATDEVILPFGMRAPPGGERDVDAWGYWYRLGHITIREVPEGTKDHRDLRPWVASPGDLVRMMEALGRPEEKDHLDAMRRVVELEGGWHVER